MSVEKTLSGIKPQGWRILEVSPFDNTKSGLRTPTGKFVVMLPVIQNFCNPCDFYDRNDTTCLVLNKNDQGRAALNGACKGASVRGREGVLTSEGLLPTESSTLISRS